MPKPRNPAPTLADSLFNEAEPPVGSTALRRVRNALSRAAMPTTVEAIERPCGLSRDRIKATLAVLELRNEVKMNRRGDVIFEVALNPTPAPESATAA